MMLESFVMCEARILVKDKGKDALLDEGNIKNLVATALMKMDNASNIPTRSKEYYRQTTYRHTYSILPKLKNFYDNFNVKKDDANLDIEEKRQLMKNSINILQPFIQDLKDNHQYNEYQEKNLKSKTADYIIENLLVKIEDDKELNKILNSLDEIGMNFWITDDENNIYPLVTDLLMDIISLEYAWQVDKKLIQAIFTKWDDAVEAQKDNNFFTINSYTKMELLKKAKYYNLRTYLLAEYTRVLNVDNKKLRLFMKHILYYIIENHKNTMQLNFDAIKEIPTRPFLLEKTKIVIGGE